MTYRTHAIQITCALIIGLLSMTSVGANTCPVNLKQDDKGFWYSDEKPTWRSHKATNKDIVVKASNFGGAVYSPIHHRIACLYKDSENNWLAIVSKVNYTFAIDRAAKDDSGKEPAWKWSEKHKDYSCGNPHVKNITGCQFTIDNSE